MKTSFIFHKIDEYIWSKKNSKKGFGTFKCKLTIVTSCGRHSRDSSVQRLLHQMIYKDTHCNIVIYWINKYSFSHVLTCFFFNSIICLHIQQFFLMGKVMKIVQTNKMLWNFLIQVKFTSQYWVLTDDSFVVFTYCFSFNDHGTMTLWQYVVWFKKFLFTIF